MLSEQMLSCLRRLQSPSHPDRGPEHRDEMASKELKNAKRDCRLYPVGSLVKICDGFVEVTTSRDHFLG